MTDAPVELRWAVKESFLRYLGSMPGSQIALGGGTQYTDGEFRFAGTEEGGVVTCSGAIRFTGHGGMLEVLLAEPVVEVSDAGGTLSVLDVYNPATEPPTRLTLATLARESEEPLVYAAQLAEAGVELFNNVYPAGEPLAPVRIVRDPDPDPRSPS